MPIFDYKCDGCAMDFQYLFRDGVPPICPRCWDQSVTKQLSTFSAQVAGKNVESAKSGQSTPAPTETEHVHTATCGHNHKPSAPCPGSQSGKLIEKHLGK